MKKSLILAAAAAFVLASCAKNEVVRYADQDEVSFGAYSGRTITKAGSTDDMNLEALKKADAGFGVFATYTETADFSVANDNFMYNEKITWDGTSAWTYSPVKYWPNPTNGKSADDQKVSFFAYAPYADPTATGADNSYGITGFAIENNHDIVNYTFAANKPNVDLMWGYKTKTAGTPDVYTVNENLTRPASNTDKVTFIFQHVLSKLGGSQEGAITDPEDAGYVANGLIIKANAETITPTNEFGTATGTKITVSKLIVESAPAEDPVGTPVTDIDGNPISYATGAQTGKLDLYTGEFALDGTAQSIQFKQTLTNNPAEITATPATADSELAERIAEPATFASFAALPKGVTATAVNAYKDESNPIILVPGTKPVVDVTITYIVRTYDEKLGTKQYTDVPQTVWGRVKFPAIEKNKKYNLLIILGLNDVKFEATVEDWTVVGQTWNDANGDGIQDPGEVTGIDTEVWLPENL